MRHGIKYNYLDRIYRT